MSVAVARPWWPPAATTTVEMGEARIPWDDYFPNSYWRRPITDHTPYQHPTHPTANSANWVRSLCVQMDLDPATGLRIPGANAGKAWMGPSNPLYIVPPSQPRRPLHGSNPGMLTTTGGKELDALLRLGAPVPEDAVTENYYIVVGNPLSGSFSIQVIDGRRGFEFVTSAIPNNVTAVALQAALAEGFTGAGLDPAQEIRSCKGGPLDKAQIQVAFPPNAVVLLKVNDTTSPAVRVSGGGDRWLNVWQPGSDSLWELFSARRSDPYGPLDFGGWGGVILNRVSEHIGTYTRREDVFGVVTEHERWSGNACSMVNLPWIDLELYAECVEEQVAYPSAIPLSLGKAQGSPIQYVWPATRGDGVEGNRPDMIPEGARIAFPPGSDYSRVRPQMMPLALAGEKYGIIPRDKTGLGVNVQLRGYSNVGSSKAWGSVFDPWQPNADVTSLPWHQAVIVHPDQSR